MTLTIDRLSKQYKNKIAVDRVSLSLENGVYGLLGANGAGKTTLMRMLCGVLTPTAGTVNYDKYSVSSEEYRDLLGYLPQDFGYYPDFTAEEFLVYIGTLKGLPKQKAKEKAREMLELVSLKEVSKKKIKTFSGGMKQRLGIAQSMLNNPKILILDEPTAGLDPKERIKFRNLISTLGAGKIVLLSTHIVSDIESIANEIILMKDGQIKHKGCLEDIIKAVENKVWECVASQKEAENFILNYTVANTKNHDDKVTMRIISDVKPSEDAKNIEPTLEDLYLYYFQEVRENA